jgi:glycine cleavage system T protein
LHEADPKRFPGCFNSAQALAERVPEILGTHYSISYPGVQLNSARGLRKTPLHQRWVEAGAHFGQFFDWERPLYFGKKKEPVLGFGKPDWFDQVGQEVDQAHNRAAIFDQSTFGKIRVEGSHAEAFLNRVCANDMTRAPGKAIYTAMLNERGGFESDLTALRLNREKYRLYVGTGAVKRDMAWLKRHLNKAEKVTISDETEDFAVFGLMGPKADSIVSQLNAEALNELPYFHHCSTSIQGVSVEAARLSYVGEAGWELTCASADAVKLYDLMYAAGARPAGIFAQTSMRIEKGFLAYGHDLDSDLNPMQAGLDFAIDWQSDFIGKQALQEKLDQATVSRIVSITLESDNAWPLGNEPVYYNGNIIGKTTSAAFGYRIGNPVAIALVKVLPEIGLDQLNVEVDIARTSYAGTIQTKAAFDPDGKRMRN